MNFVSLLPSLRKSIPAALVLLLTLLSTLLIWNFVAHNIAMEQGKEFDAHSEQIKLTLERRIQSYSYVLNSFRPLFQQYPQTNFTHWKIYANTLSYHDYYPEINSIVFTKNITLAERDTFAAAMRMEVQDSFTLHPEGDREFYQPVTFVEPFDERAKKSLGFDLWTEPVRRAAMEIARDTGQPSISHKITLLHQSDSDHRNSAGFLIFLPIYQGNIVPETVEQRRNKLLGFIFCPFSLLQLIDNIQNDTDSSIGGLEIYDGDSITSDTLLYQDDFIANPDNSKFKKVLTVNIGQHLWNLRFSSTPEFDNENDAPFIILFVGTLVSFLLSSLTLSLTHSRNTLLQKQKVEQALLKSEERFNLAIRGSHDGVWDWDINSGQMYCSPRFNEILGLPIEQPLSIREWGTLIHPEDTNKAWKDVHAYLEKRCPYYHNLHRMRHRAGHYIWCLSRGTAVWDQDGHPIRMVGTYSDVTKQKAVEEALRQSEERFELAMRGANDGLWDWNIQNNAAYFSPRFKQILGFTAEQQLSLSAFLQLIHEDDYPTIKNITAAYFTKQRPTYEARYRVKHQQGHDIWLLSRGIAVWNTARHAVRMIGTAIDITHQKQAEEELHLAKEAAEHANQAKSSFLANMSHELRTPLNAILGYTQILEWDEEITAQQREGINIIKRSGEYLLTLINDILDLSKIEAGRIELNSSDFNFNDFIQGVVDLFKMRAQQKNIAFIYEPLTALPVGVAGDERRLRQVLINLVGNALKFTKEGGVTLKISYEMPYIRFQIEDTGIGIAEEDLTKIFLPFQQVGDQNYRAEGTGLGLSITQRLVNMMNGELQVQSELGHGSRFSVIVALPLAKSPLPSIPEQQPLIIGFEGIPAKILLIDDKWENRSVLRNLLGQLGFITLEAEHGARGVELAAQELPDLIITDLVMPVMDGFEAARQIRKLPALANTPIIAASASVFDCHQQQSRDAGCNDFIPKPIKTELLLGLLQKHLLLTWKYADSQLYSPPVNCACQEYTTVPLNSILSRTQIEKLLELTKLGDIQAIVDYTHEFPNNADTPCIHKIQQLAKNFDIAGIDSLLRQLLND